MEIEIKIDKYINSILSPNESLNRTIQIIMQ